jgi:hypothetical protein
MRMLLVSEADCNWVIFGNVSDAITEVAKVAYIKNMWAMRRHNIGHKLIEQLSFYNILK